MSNFKCHCALLAASIGLSMASTATLAVINPNAPVVYLKKDCTAQDDCFTDELTMTYWVSDTRVPDANSPLTIEIDPGTYSFGGLTCSSDSNGVPNSFAGYVSIKGSGRRQTIMQNGNVPFLWAFRGGCKNISVQDLTIDGANVGVGWFGGGSSTWTNVELRGSRAPWYDAADQGGSSCSGKGADHRFYASSLILRTDNGLNTNNSDILFSACGQVWIGGSELRAEVDANFITGTVRGVRSVGPNNLVRIYGSDVRLFTTNNATATTLIGLKAEAGGQIHLHGGEVVTRHNNPAVSADVISAWADGAGSMVHTIMTSYGVLPAGTGTPTRAMATNGGMTQVPFTWPASTEPPTPGGQALVSLPGMDTFVETDCPDTVPMGMTVSCASGSGNATHHMSYNPSCAGGWYDMTLNSCR